ncbi:helix-turn-helix domain-containing protein [Aquamicrobium defluvii]|uniref:helix-turn-helix domain-containing protein n=1 Tax=Aquamicrobium defluvii TaxID=69279 RepID=UPI00105DBF0E|nr:helix-turn-helix transcriptional regulator [Aquamicrobium defluvii]
MDIHDRIAHARRMAGLTQDEVADHFGIKRPSVAQWEGKRSKPSMNKIVELARLLNTTPEWIINESGDPPVKMEAQEADSASLIPPDLEREFLERLRSADPAVRDSVLTLLGLRPKT